MSRAPRTITAPASYPPVADVVDPEFGPDEIPPCPPADGPGTVYVVGDERETWVAVPTRGADVLGFAFVGPAGRVLGGRDMVRMCLRRGARLMRMLCWRPPHMARADIGSPLAPEVAAEPVQLALFAGAAP